MLTPATCEIGGHKITYARPSMKEQQRDGILNLAADMNEVNSQRLIAFALDFSDELWQFIQLRLRPPPIIRL